MKFTKILMMLVLMVGMVSTPADTQAFDNLENPILVAAAVAGITLLYMHTDSNETLIRRAHDYMDNVDTCQDLLPPSTWQGTTETYFEQYVHNKFGIQVTDIRKGSDYTYDLVSKYVKKMKLKLAAARQCVEFRSMFFAEMNDTLSKIKLLESLLARASNDAVYYDKFLQAHQIINFHAKLPMFDSAGMKNSSEREQQAAVVKTIRRGYFSNEQYPLIRYQESLSADLKFIREYLDGSDYNSHHDRVSTKYYPQLVASLIACQDALELAFDILLEAPAYGVEKDAKHKADLLQAEQAKARAQMAAARAQQDAANAQQRQVWAQQKANKIAEEANKIAKNNKKK